MKKLTKKQILIVNNEIRKTALKMRNNSNNPYEVIGFYTSKIENLTNLIEHGYEECLSFEDRLKCIINCELSSQEENSHSKWAYMLKMLKNNKLTSRGFWTILGGMIIVTFVIESFIEFIFNLIDF